jgi:hypothetical protein
MCLCDAYCGILINTILLFGEILYSIHFGSGAGVPFLIRLATKLSTGSSSHGSISSNL